MKNIITILLVAISIITFAQDTSKYSFETEITAFRNFEGQVLVQIFNNKQEVVKTLIATFKDEKCNFQVNNLSKGDYAIRFFHDENSDNKLSMKWNVIPEEGFGYSNNASSYFGEPDFKDWLFTLDENKSLHLKVNYLF